jgi:hypothetical protein
MNVQENWATTGAKKIAAPKTCKCKKDWNKPKSCKCKKLKEFCGFHGHGSSVERTLWVEDTHQNEEL